MGMKTYLLNQAKCNECGDIITSEHRHDFVTCSCHELSVDGGSSYLKRSFLSGNYTELSIEDDGKFQTRRKYLRWGKNFDENMNKLPETIWDTIENLNTGHIEAVLEGGFCNIEIYLETFKEELEWRLKN